MTLSGKELLDALAQKLPEEAVRQLAARVRSLSPSAVLTALGDVNISIDGDGNILGNNNQVLVVKGKAALELAKVLREAFQAGRALHQLPPPPGDFMGREQEIDDILSKIEKGTVISGLQGMGGVGKTALALVLAERLAERYRDAQFYLDLKGTSPQPLTPGEAMASVIRGYRPAQKLPEKEAELSGLYHSVLDGQRAILLMDNARDAAQVTPLLPPTGCLLLVTSRWHFALPGLYAKNLDTLPPEDACKLLVAIAPRINGQAVEIARLCGHLPLALRAAGSALAETVDLAPADYATRLGDARKRLELVEASLGLSYELLPPELQARFAALAVFPETFGRAAAATVWAIEPDPAQDALSSLLKYSLLEYDAAKARYWLHDLVRDFAHARLTSVERAEAERRHAAHYVEVAGAADKLYLKGGEGVTRGLALFDAEWANIQAGQAWAAAHAEGDEEAARLCSNYPGRTWNLLDLRLHPREHTEWQEPALAAARRLRDRAAERAHLGNLGIAYMNLGETRRAVEYHEQALTIVRELGDRRAEGLVLGNLGNSYAVLGETRRAIEFYEQQLAITGEIVDRRVEGAVLGNLGIAYSQLGEPRRAIEFYQKALEIEREIGDRRGEGQDLGNLGNPYLALGETRNAIEFYEQSLGIAREVGDRRLEGQMMGNLGLAYAALGETRRAMGFYEKRLVIAREIGDRRGEGNVLGNLGLAYADLGDTRRAIEFYEKCLLIHREIGDRRGEGYDLGNLSIAYRQLGETRRAIEFYEKQLVITREIGDRRGEGNALFNMSLALEMLGDRAQAIAHAEAALKIYVDIEDPNADQVRRQLAEWGR